MSAGVAALALWLLGAALTALALTVAYVTAILYLAIRGNWRARVLAAAMTAGAVALVLWVIVR